MPTTTQKIVPCLWFDHQAEEAAKYYTGIVKNSKITGVSHYTEVGREIHGRKPGSVMTVAFELDGQAFTALNGGPDFKFSEATSFQVLCETQKEIDHYWDQLSQAGDASAQQCGWLKDKFGLSWQILPKVLPEMMADRDQERAGRVMEALLQMKKLDLAELERAYKGVGVGV
jgi:predicted 3-demethylubiquinone-9 3-methyltransferase (glyoxalase superfamily)